MIRHDADDGAVGNRDAHFAVGANGMWDPDEPHADTLRRWIRNASKRLRPFSIGGNYIHFRTAAEGDERIRATYGASFDRLLDVKRTYDPDNQFRWNRKIRPQTGGGAR